MSMRARRRRFVFLACLLLAVWPAPGTRAEEQTIYKWMDENGQIHFTATPPPRNARPIGTKPQAKQPVQIVPMPAPSRPTSVAPRTAPARQKALRDAYARSAATAEAAERVDCGRHESSLSRVKSAQRSIDALQSSIERLENDAVASTRTSCTSRGERLGACQGASYSRDRELERAREKLQAAEDELADAEQAARAASVPPECMNRD